MCAFRAQRRGGLIWNKARYRLQRLQKTPGRRCEVFCRSPCPRLCIPQQADMPAVLTFLVLGAVIALLLGGHADGTLLDLVCAGGCGVLLWEKLMALSETLCTQIESWNRFLLGFLPVYAGVLTLGGESVAGASAGGFLLTMLCTLAQGLTVLVPPLLQCYLALSMACCIYAETGLGSFCKAVGRALEKLLGWAGKLLVALLGLERISTLQLDRVALRTGQLLTGTVPIIGETLRDASETVLSSLQLLKSGLGLAALLTIAAEFVPVYLGMLVQLGLLSRVRASMRTDGQ